jgi:ectoine hydroxylase-related dioxygenase (phytanoyl-CoA dioxygenase family)
LKSQLANQGFSIIDNIYTDIEINNLLETISNADHSKPTFRKTNDLFAIRQFFKEIPEAVNLVFNQNLKIVISTLFGDNYFAVKSIYFDKPETSNWFVSYHQDLTISVNKKMELDGFSSWTTKQNQFAVQPPLSILEDNFTIRIHLDDTTEENGALHIIPQSHAKGIYRPETIDWTIEKEMICTVEKGGIMLMKPLLLHASGRTTNRAKRRVLHIEFSRTKLPNGLEWVEFLALN